MKPSCSALIPLCLWALCLPCVADEQVGEKSLQIEVDTELLSGPDSDPMVDGISSASELSTYFDQIFGTLGHWLAYAFSDNRPIEAGNLSSSTSFMNGERAAVVDSGRLPSSRELLDGAGNHDKAPLDLGPSGTDGGPRIESGVRIAGGSIAEGFLDDPLFARSEAAIDKYFAANVVHSRTQHSIASNLSLTSKGGRSAKAIRFSVAPEATAVSLSIQAVPEPSPILLGVVATVMVALRRRRPHDRLVGVVR